MYVMGDNDRAEGTSYNSDISIMCTQRNEGIIHHHAKGRILRIESNFNWLIQYSINALRALSFKGRGIARRIAAGCPPPWLDVGVMIVAVTPPLR